MSLELSSERADVDLDFVLVNRAALRGDDPAIISCAGLNVFDRVDIDFGAQELTVNGAKTVDFAACGIDADPADPAWEDKAAFATLAVPVETAEGLDFAGTYHYTHAVLVH